MSDQGNIGGVRMSEDAKIDNPMERFKRRGLDPALNHRSMQTVKGLGILMAAEMLIVGCKEESREVNTPERKPESPLKKVDEIIANVEGVKPIEKPVKPAETEEDGEDEAPKIPVAEPVPDKPGFVISPYNGKWIDVTGVKPGTLMADPHFTEEKKFFRVPEVVLPPEGESEEGAPEEKADESDETEETV